VITEAIADVLFSSAEDVLGTMFFTPVVERIESSSEFECHASVRLCFLGGSHADPSEPRGHLDLEVSRDAAQLIASNFLAAGGSVPSYRVDDVLCELANVICGNVMSRLASDQGFSLLSPELTPRRQEGWPGARVFEERLELERGWLTLRFGLVHPSAGKSEIT
jgi:hypothetical protein